MTRIFLFSDTHGWFDPTLETYCRAADEIWHAGDWGPGVADQLRIFGKPVRGVYGNIDTTEVRTEFPLHLRFSCEDLTIGMTHIAGVPGRYKPDARRLFAEGLPDIFVCGHSHILRVERDPAKNNLLFINPGAAGREGFHRMRTALRFSIEGRRVFGMEVIELGKRGAIPDNFAG